MALTIGMTSDWLMESIKRVIREKTGEMLDEEIAAAEKRVRERMLAMADQIALGVLTTYDMSMDQDRVLITVRK